MGKWLTIRACIIDDPFASLAWITAAVRVAGPGCFSDDAQPFARDLCFAGTWIGAGPGCSDWGPHHSTIRHDRRGAASRAPTATTSRRTSMGDVVGAFKSISTMALNKLGVAPGSTPFAEEFLRAHHTRRPRAGDDSGLYRS